MNRLHIKDMLNKSSVKHSSFASRAACTGSCTAARLVNVCERHCYELDAEEAAARDRLPDEPWERPPAALLSSLPSPPFLLTCAVRGDISLSDRLCDPPSGLGGRRSAVNINTFLDSWRTWSSRGHHESSSINAGRKTGGRRHVACRPPCHPPLCTTNKQNATLRLAPDCLLGFISSQVDGAPWHPRTDKHSSFDLTSSPFSSTSGYWMLFFLFIHSSSCSASLHLYIIIF